MFFERAISHLQILLTNTAFKFSSADPTSSCYCNLKLNNERLKLISYAFEDLKNIYHPRPGK